MHKEHRLPDRPSKLFRAWVQINMLREAIGTMEQDLLTMDYKLPPNIHTPWATSYDPELDFSPFLDDEHKLVLTTHKNFEMGSWTWMIDTHLSILNLCLLKTHPRYHIILDDTEPLVDEEQFHNADWTSFYPDAKEPIPLHVPPPRGNQVLIACFMDEYHAGNHATRRLNTWILIFCYCAPIIWYSERQNTMETSSFGSEFIALRIAVELIEALRFKLWMIGLPVKGPHNVYCDKL